MLRAGSDGPPIWLDAGATKKGGSICTAGAPAAGVTAEAAGIAAAAAAAAVAEAAAAGAAGALGLMLTLIPEVAEEVADSAALAESAPCAKHKTNEDRLTRTQIHIGRGTYKYKSIHVYIHMPDRRCLQFDEELLERGGGWSEWAVGGSDRGV